MFDKIFVEYAAIDVDRHAADYVATNNIRLMKKSPVLYVKIDMKK